METIVTLTEKFTQKYPGKSITRKDLHKTDRKMYDALSAHPNLFEKLLPSKTNPPRKGLSREEVEKMYVRKYGENTSLERHWLHDNDRGMYERLKSCNLLNRYAPLKSTANVNSEEYILKEFEEIKNRHLLSRTELNRKYSSLYHRAGKNQLIERLIPKIKRRGRKTDLKNLIETFQDLPNCEKIDRTTLKRTNKSLFYRLKRAKLLDELLPSNIRRYSNVSDVINEFQKQFGEEKIPRKRLISEDRSLSESLRARNLLDKISYRTEREQIVIPDPTETRLQWIENLETTNNNDLLSKMLPSLTRIAKRFAGKYHLDLDDLISEATISILENPKDEETAKKEAVANFYKLLNNKKNMISINLNDENGKKRQDLEPADYRELLPLEALIKMEDAA